MANLFYDPAILKVCDLPFIAGNADETLREEYASNYMSCVLEGKEGAREPIHVKYKGETDKLWKILMDEAVQFEKVISGGWTPPNEIGGARFALDKYLKNIFGVTLGEITTPKFDVARHIPIGMDVAEVDLKTLPQKLWDDLRKVSREELRENGLSILLQHPINPGKLPGLLKILGSELHDLIQKGMPLSILFSYNPDFEDFHWIPCDIQEFSKGDVIRGGDVQLISVDVSSRDLAAIKREVELGVNSKKDEFKKDPKKTSVIYIDFKNVPGDFTEGMAEISHWIGNKYKEGAEPIAYTPVSSEVEILTEGEHVERDRISAAAFFMPYEEAHKKYEKERIGNYLDELKALRNFYPNSDSTVGCLEGGRVLSNCAANFYRGAEIGLHGLGITFFGTVPKPISTNVVSPFTLFYADPHPDGVAAWAGPPIKFIGKPADFSSLTSFYGDKRKRYSSKVVPVVVEAGLGKGHMEERFWELGNVILKLSGGIGRKERELRVDFSLAR